MKWMIASDIHGYTDYCRKLVEVFKKEKADKLVLLGDLCRGRCLEEIGPSSKEECEKLLNSIADSILAVRGNWDAREDDKYLNFPLNEEVLILPFGSRRLLLAHGVHYRVGRPPKEARPGDIILLGHTHKPMCYIGKDVATLNPGSFSQPYEATYCSYMTLEDGVFRWFDPDGNMIMYWDSEEKTQI